MKTGLWSSGDGPAETRTDLKDKAGRISMERNVHGEEEVSEEAH